VEGKSNKEKAREFWDDRAPLGQEAGTRDIVAKRLEIKAILNYVRDGLTVLDVGCGNGITAIEIAKQYDIDITGFDFSGRMIEEARKLSKNEDLVGNVTFRQGDIQDFPAFSSSFDLILTERALINLPDWPKQKKAIEDIVQLLSPNGRLLMCENSQDGLDAGNRLRKQVGLEEIEPPWHNRYFKDAELETLSLPDLELERIEYFTSTYYFLSRVVNAWLASREGKSPEYDAPVNKLALELPVIGTLGQTRLWVWRKES